MAARISTLQIGSPRFPTERRASNTTGAVAGYVRGAAEFLTREMETLLFVSRGVAAWESGSGSAAPDFRLYLRSGWRAFAMPVQMLDS